MSIWHWLVVALYGFLLFAMFDGLARVLRRTGYSGWWSLLALVPIVNIIALWRFSKAEWRPVG